MLRLLYSSYVWSLVDSSLIYFDNPLKNYENQHKWILPCELIQQKRAEHNIFVFIHALFFVYFYVIQVKVFILKIEQKTHSNDPERAIYTQTESMLFFV